MFVHKLGLESRCNMKSVRAPTDSSEQAGIDLAGALAAALIGEPTAPAW
jgi:hypothetical protein